METDSAEMVEVGPTILGPVSKQVTGWAKSGEEKARHHLQQERDTFQAISPGRYNAERSMLLSLQLACENPEMLIPYDHNRIRGDQIRVLDLYYLRQEDGGSEVLGGRLRRIFFNPAAPEYVQERYEALSYAWGPTYEDGSHLTHWIVCANARLRVTAHLHRALIRISQDASPHSHKKVATLWIDAICIDQKSLAERAVQVAKMDQIFACASKITVWLGEPSSGETGNRELRFVRSIRRSYEGESDAFMLSEADRRSAAKRAERNRPVMEALVSRPWFQRRWVIQEVLAARRNQYSIRLGDATCQYSEFYNELRYSDLRLQAGPMTLRTRPLTLLQNIHLYDRSECSDPLDRIFALRNLAADGKTVAVDYGHDVRHTYLNVSMTITLGTAYDPTHRAPLLCPGVVPLELLRLLVLASCKKRRRDDDQAVAEAWVPDFRLRNRFAHDEHERAVTLALSPSCMLHPDRATLHLPDAVDVDEVGHCYLRISPAVEDSSAARREHGARLPTTGELSPVAWLPWRQVDFRGQSMPEMGIGFFLDPGQTRLSYKGHPVYRLYSCFRLSTYWTVPESYDVAPDAPDAVQRPPVHFLGEETFYIE